MATTVALLPYIPAGYVVVSESGLQDRATITRLEHHGVAAFLIGESLMREADIGTKLEALRRDPSAWKTRRYDASEDLWHDEH